MTAEAAWTLLIDAPADGPTNMAVDSALLEAVAPGDRPILRLYRWDPPTLSLGVFQKFDDRAEQGPEIEALPVVRRVTGGGAILHADELTYSLVAPIDHPLAKQRPDELYTWMHERLARAVETLGGRSQIKGDGPTSARCGPFLCFACHGRFDLVAGLERAKLAGSAQRRTRKGILQHGSLVRRRSHPIQPSAAVEELIGRRVEYDELIEAVIKALEQSGVKLGQSGRSAPAGDIFDRYYAQFAGDEWTKRR